MNPIRYFIQGKSESGKTTILKEWLNRLERMNGVYLPYEGGTDTPIIRLDYGKRKIKEQGGWISKKIAISYCMELTASLSRDISSSLTPFVI